MFAYVLLVKDRGVFRAFLDSKTKTPLFTNSLHDAKRFKNDHIARQFALFNDLEAEVRKIGFVEDRVP